MSRFKVMKRRQAGFSLLELMIVLLVMSIMMGAIFQQITLVQQRAQAEQNKLDIFQEAREFMDQMGRDLKQAGYPNARNYTSTAIAGPTDQFNAVGIVKVDAGELMFEADNDGTGQVQSIHYYLDSTGTNCPCLRRSQLPKIPGDPLPPPTGGQSLPVYWTEVQNVQNTNIFTAYDPSGTPIALPIDFDNQPDKIGKVKSIQVVLTVQAPIPDIKTRQKPIINLTQTIKLNNCSAAQTCVDQGGGVIVCAPGGDAAMSCSQ